ncbi:MAG: protein translocase subunit SecD [Acidobacteriota bacterium]|nr:MAG: protein translocase subunit SecD [Acidobacteriota bacterium]
MKNTTLLIRSAIIIAVTILAIFIVIGPRGSFTAGDFSWQGIKNNLANNINLGLDLKGGLHLVARVRTDEYLRDLTSSNSQAALKAAQDQNLPVTGTSFTAENGTYEVVLNVSDISKAEDIVKAVNQKVDFLNWDSTTGTETVSWSLPVQAQSLIKQQATDQAIQIIDSRINQFGVTEPTLQKRGTADSGEILLQMPGVDDPKRVKDLIDAESKLALYKVVSPPNPNLATYPTKEAALQTIGGAPTATRDVYEYVERDDSANGDQAQQQPAQPTQWIVVEKPPIIEGDELRDANAVSQTGNEGDYQISFSLKPAGATKFGEWTGRNINNYMAVVLNDQAKSVAFIQSQIFDQGQISGQFTKATADDLALTLKSGALPARLEYLEERTVGPSLGADSIASGVRASVGGLFFVIIFMLVYYRGAGINAVVALMLNMVLTLAALIVLDATLTLPGIAGLILGIGMAVDSNVLIFERMREEIKAGKLVSKAVELGFDRAFITIIDTHVTTIIAAVILYLYGSGPIRGFAVTLILGLIINLFSAVFVSRTIFLWILERNPGLKKLSI